MTRLQPLRSRGGPVLVLAATLLLIAGGIVAAQGNGATQLRRFIDQQVGGIREVDGAGARPDLPQPRLANGSPTRSSRQPRPSATSGNCCFTTRRERPGLSRSSVAFPPRATASCGTCHLGEAASKSGTLLNFAMGGEGRGYTDAEETSLRAGGRGPNCRILRQTPLFPGDALVDALPTLTDIYRLADGSEAVPPGVAKTTGPRVSCWNRST